MDYIGKTCPYCQTPIKPGEVVHRCEMCNMVHHADCWRENEGCTTFGCEGKAVVPLQVNQEIPNVALSRASNRYVSSVPLATELSNQKKLSFLIIGLLVGGVLSLIFFQGLEAKKASSTSQDQISYNEQVPEAEEYNEDPYAGQDNSGIYDLSADSIRRLFSAEINDDGNNYDVEDIKWQEGSFSEPNASEAIVSFYDNSQCHASGWSEVCLLRKDTSNWNLVGKLFECDEVDFDICNIDSDGKSEIWVYGSGGNQGAFSSFGELISVQGNSKIVVFSNEGFDDTGTGHEGQMLCEHSVELSDLDYDGLDEIIDTETTKWFAYTGKEFDSDYVEVSSSRLVSTYKLIEGQYELIKQQ